MEADREVVMKLGQARALGGSKDQEGSGRIVESVFVLFLFT